MCWIRRDTKNFAKPKHIYRNRIMLTPDAHGKRDGGQSYSNHEKLNNSPHEDKNDLTHSINPEFQVGVGTFC